MTGLHWILAVMIQLLVLYSHLSWQVKVSGMVWCCLFD
jgi:hypothetical protein